MTHTSTENFLDNIDQYIANFAKDIVLKYGTKKTYVIIFVS